MGGISAKEFEEFNHPDFVRRLKAGNNAAYSQFVESLSPWVKNFVRKKYGLSEEDVADITQDFFRRLVEKITLYDEGEERFLAWAFQVLRNLAVDWLRRYKKLNLIPLDSLQKNRLGLSIDDNVAKTPRDDLSPLEKLPAEVRSAFLKLNDRYQQFLGLMLLGIRDEEILKAMNLSSKGALWTLRTRAVAKLKEEVEKTKSPRGGQ